MPHHSAAVLPRYDGYPTDWFTPPQCYECFYGNTDLAAGNWAPMTGPNVPRPFLGIPNRRGLQPPLLPENPRRFFRIQAVLPPP